MDIQILEYEKSFEKRLEEYNSIFNTAQPWVTSYDLKAVWSDYLETSIEPIGWLGVWYPSKSKCLEYGLNFSYSILVIVSSMNYNSLTADVKVVHTESKKKYEFLPEKLSDVPLIDLYIALEQSETELNFSVTAECLDQLRIFYKYLWWPWDEDDISGPSDWVSKYLESRLQLYYDLIKGNYHDRVSKTIKSLIEKGQIVFQKIRAIPDDTVLEMEEEGLTCSSQAISAIKAINELEFIKNKLLRLTKRNMLMLLHVNASLKKHITTGYVVLLERQMKDVIDYFKQASNMCHDMLQFKRSFFTINDVLQCYDTNDVILLSPEKHYITSERLDVNVTIKGLFEENKSIICESDPFWYLLKTTADDVNLSNLIINIEKCQTAIYVKEGVTCLDSVVIRNENGRKAKAVIVEDNATLLVNKCQFYNFNVGVICLSGSAVEFKDCIFHNNDVAVEILNGAQVCLKNVDALKSNRVPIRYNGGIFHEQFQSLEALADIDTIVIHSVTVTDEQKAVEFV